MSIEALSLSGLAAPTGDQSLESFVGGIYGDLVSDEPSEPAGAPPAEPTDPTEPEQALEGTEESAPAAEPAAEADRATVPDAEAQQEPTELDPLDGAEPLAYTVSGQSRTFDGITRLKDGGAIVDPDAVDKLVRVLGERDHLYEQQQTTYSRLQDLERLTAWNEQGPDGKTRTITGPEAVVAARVTSARSAKALETLVQALESPDRFLQLHDLVQDQAGNWQIVRNETAYKMLLREASLAAGEAAMTARQHFHTMAQPQPAPEPTLAELAPATVKAAIQTAGVTGLTPEDEAFLVGQFPRYVRDATPEERRQYGHPKIVDQAFPQLIKTLAARTVKATTTATTQASAKQANQAKLAAASVGAKKPAAAPARRPANTPPQQPTREDDFDAAWDRRMSAMSGVMRSQVAG